MGLEGRSYLEGVLEDLKGLGWVVRLGLVGDLGEVHQAVQLQPRVSHIFGELQALLHRVNFSKPSHSPGSTAGRGSSGSASGGSWPAGHRRGTRTRSPMDMVRFWS